MITQKDKYDIWEEKYPGILWALNSWIEMQGDPQWRNDERNWALKQKSGKFGLTASTFRRMASEYKNR